MKLPRVYRLEEIALLLDCDFKGDPNFPVHGFNEIHRVEHGDIVFVDHPKYYDKALNSAASIVIINQERDVPEGKALLLSDDPFRDFNKLAIAFKPFIPPSNQISSDAKIGEHTVIMPGVFIGNRVQIGKNCRIHANVNIVGDTKIGNDVIIQANTVIGSDAFYYKKRTEGYERLISTGNVIIENNVEIGASCTIDRGVSGSTIIGEGSKFDNQVQIGHDTHIGKHCLFAAQVGVAGCVNIKDKVTLWGQVGINSGVTLGEGAVILGQSGVSKSLEGGKTYFGSPAEESRRKYRELASMRILPEIIEGMELRS